MANTPSMNHHVNDHGHILSNDTIHKIEEKLQNLEETDSTQIIILTITQLENETIEQFAYRIFQYYKIGHKNKDNGVLICVSKNDRALRIEWQRSKKAN